MYNINKIRAHIKMLEFQEIKLSRYLREQESLEVRNIAKIADIKRAHKRVTDNISLWKNKLEHIEQLPSKTN